MRIRQRWTFAIILLGFTCTFAIPATAQTDTRTAAQRDGQDDFDFEIGTWKTHVSRRVKPLSGSTIWVEYDGTSVVRELFGGRANTVELSIDGGSAGKIEGVSLRLYDPQSRQWSLNYASLVDGAMTLPVVGSFSNGRGEFFGKDTLGERPILVRFVITDIARDSTRFEQAFSADNGKTWEVNWIATDTRIPDK